MQITTVDHPLAQVQLSLIRDAASDNPTFRAALRELSQMLVYEACRDLPTEPFELTTPVSGTTGRRVSNFPLLVPVLRAGLGMLDAALALLPGSQTGFVGLHRDEQTLQPAAYMQQVPDSLAGWPVLVLDPMLATGGSLVHTVRLLRERGATDITCVCVIAAPEGVHALEAAYPEARLVTAAVDERLNEVGFIVPGLGDAGDRQFN